MNVMDYIIQQAYILIPVLYVIGLLLKKTPFIPDWLIPWILLVLGIAGGFFLGGMQLEGILQGVLVTGVTVFANQLYVQTAIKRTNSAGTEPVNVATVADPQSDKKGDDASKG